MLLREPVPPTLTVDILNLEWWQALVVLLAALGLSPAPWLLGLARGRIQFTAPAERAYTARTEELKAAHAREVDSLHSSHAAAIAEIVSHHEDLVGVKDAAYSEMKESRDYYRRARLEERDRADAATDQLAEVVEVAKASMQALHAIDEAAKDANR